MLPQITRRLRISVVIAVTLGIVGGTMYVVSGQHGFIDSHDIPNPFATTRTNHLAGSVTKVGMKGDTPVLDLSFPGGVKSEELGPDAIHFILTPDDASDGAPLSDVFTHDQRIFGYKYTSADAARERQARDAAAAGGPSALSDLFPGEFFASDAQRRDGTFIGDFEGANGIIFKSLDDVTLDTNARYIVISNDPARVQVRDIAMCGDGKLTDEEECDDGNTNTADGCSSCAVDSGFECTGAPSSCMDTRTGGEDGNTDGTDPSGGDTGNTDGSDGSGGDTGNSDGTMDGTDQGEGDGAESGGLRFDVLCGNGSIDLGETCDDENTDDGDGCNADCEQEEGFTCVDEPSNCYRPSVCGDGTIDEGEQCDDGNTDDGDSCSSSCEFLVAPI